MPRCRLIAGSIALLAAAGACADSARTADVSGECADVHGGRVCTWARTQGGEVVELGATIPLATVANAPDQIPHAAAWPPQPIASLPYPDSVREASGFTDMTMHWEAGGHPPPAYLRPHFDFHFNMIPASERMAIDCTDTTKPASVPDAYAMPDIQLPPAQAKLLGVPVIVGLCVPQMGMHAMPASELDQHHSFRGTMVIGYYRGKPIFLEPMISKAMLLEAKSFTLPIPTIPGLTTQPTGFRADYDSATQSYRFALSMK